MKRACEILMSFSTITKNKILINKAKLCIDVYPSWINCRVFLVFERLYNDWDASGQWSMVSWSILPPFFLDITYWLWTLFIHYILTTNCYLYIRKNIVMWDLVWFVTVYTFQIYIFYNFYFYTIGDIIG